MKLLVDTSIFLEVLLEQACADEARKFFTKTAAHDFFIFDFSLALRRANTA